MSNKPIIEYRIHQQEFIEQNKPMYYAGQHHILDRNITKFFFVNSTRLFPRVFPTRNMRKQPTNQPNRLQMIAQLTAPLEKEWHDWMQKQTNCTEAADYLLSKSLHDQAALLTYRAIEMTVKAINLHYGLKISYFGEMPATVFSALQLKENDLIWVAMFQEFSTEYSLKSTEAPNFDQLQKALKRLSEIHLLMVQQRQSNNQLVAPKANTSASSASVATSPEPDHDQPIVVPWDFTTLAQHALEHAVHAARNSGSPIKLLHIVKKKSEIAPAQKNLAAVVESLKKGQNIEAEALVVEGSIFDDISRIADDLDAGMVIMGTHGMKGLQKITGSWALKVIADTKAPFIVIQEPPINNRIANVVLPITHVRDLKKILNQVRYLHKYHQTTFHLVRLSKYANETIKKQNIANYVFIKSFMLQNDIKFTDIEENAKSYYDAAMNYAVANKCDLVVILTTKDINFQDYITGAEEQKVIANPYKLSVMCVNPLHARGYSIGTMGA